jgi:MoxR-like ATPase
MEEKTGENQEENAQNPASEHQEEPTSDIQNEGLATPMTDAEGAITTPVEMPLTGTSYVDVKPVADVAQAIRDQINTLVVGQSDMIDLMLAAILTGGHCPLEGFPGIAKTLTAKMLAKSINAEFSRIQFTPDLMPTDITGTSVFNLKESEFVFKQGPVFANIVLIDEINRAPAKTQAALMEVMEEKQITYDGQRYEMGFPFFVIATQNPVEQEGTYTLPEAQLDRFIFKIKMTYPSLEQEHQILELFQSDFKSHKVEEVKPVVQINDLKACQDIIEKVYIKPELLKYIAAVVHDTRNNGDLYLGASPRASLAIMRTSKAIAAMQGRDFVTPDDIKLVSYPVLNHRVVLSHEREMEGTTVEDVIRDIVENIEIPR